MTDGSKTFTQTSKEANTRFVSLEQASRISGYTTAYLERLCSLNRLKSAKRKGGAYAIELDSLLGETQTVLFSTDGITFLPVNELSEEPTYTTPVTLSATLLPASLPPTENMETKELPIKRIPTEDTTDPWDALLLGTQKPNIDPPPSSYRTLITAVDPRGHHDPAPLFPPLSKLPSQQLPANAAIEQIKPPQKVMRIMPTTLPPPSPRALTPAPEVLPATAPHHELAEQGAVLPSTPPPHSLLKSVGFNAAVGIFFLAATYLLLGQSIIGVFGDRVDQFIAAVGMAGKEEITTEHAPFPAAAAGSSDLLGMPFSDEVVVAEGDEDGTFYVQPIYRNGAGEVYEYARE